MAKSPGWLALSLVCGILASTPAVANILGEDPLPRVEDALCPGVMGISTSSALQILDRLRHNAGMFGIRLADPETCSPNLLVAFVADGRESIDSLMRSQPQLFESLTLKEKRALRASTAPVRAWNVLATRTRDGLMVPGRDNMSQIPQATMWSAHSKIYTATRQDIVSTVVLFDSRRVQGLTTTQLADFASMRSFAADYTALSGQQGSILSLFDAPDNRPAELTEGDLAFLRDLYAGMANIPGRAKLRGMEQQLGG